MQPVSCLSGEMFHNVRYANYFWLVYNLIAQLQHCARPRGGDPGGYRSGAGVPFLGGEAQYSRRTENPPPSIRKLRLTRLLGEPLSSEPRENL